MNDVSNFIVRLPILISSFKNAISSLYLFFNMLCLWSICWRSILNTRFLSDLCVSVFNHFVLFYSHIFWISGFINFNIAWFAKLFLMANRICMSYGKFLSIFKAVNILPYVVSYKHYDFQTFSIGSVYS